MRKQNQNQAQDQVQHQNQAEHQIQAQAQVQQQNQGGADMKPTQQMSIYFVTFVTKLDPQTSRQVLVELRRKFPTMKPVFTPVPPPGRRKILIINNIPTILTFVHKQDQGGFTVAELIKNKP